ncbi:MAG: T9SS type A sorting domain-containing protein, partial [Flavobacteriales bacterium]|nr:T9SS type A sorting domain-containing protein [Flavobacteriales bacterium]
DGEGFVKEVGQQTYTVSGVINGCNLEDDVTVNVFEQPDILFDAGEDLEICFGAQATVMASLDTDVEEFMWSGGIDDGLPFNVEIGLNTYTLSGTAFGCTYQDEVNVIGLEPIDTDFSAGPDQELCFGEDVVLIAVNSDGISFQWSEGIQDGDPFQQDEGVETYEVIANIDGCEFIDDVTVEVLPPLETPSVAFFGGELITNIADEYLWYFNGVLIPTLTEQTIIPIEDGTYQVQVVIDGCESSLSEPFTYTNILENDNKNEVKFFPNPASNILTVGNLQLTNYQIEIFTPDGRLLYSQFETKSELKIDVSSFESGILIAVIKDLEGSFLKVEQIIKL